MKYSIYTDGACSGNPGNGGYAFIVISEKDEPLTLYGSKKQTTNNHMELMAIVKALHFVTKGKERARIEVTIYSDSAYCINSINYGWVNFWQKNDWKTRNGSEVKNRELWEKYLQIIKNCKRLKLELVKVKGHSGNKYNELVDKAAKSAICRT